ncbi:hypothetical protein GRI97_13805 [Altererythrobacter xixiisoli]|uniref:TonB C-terminal domain-containing protein n=1 Tax=Croceibacterium xixiisoli TaxID=1476466 RepID=A0A6I4U089_9SPHN|nr:hypothetical protein [Croceibacterium xixiisoli]MXP00064.1 hypothetical protein [Croceibacterium xixiisoli]
MAQRGRFAFLACAIATLIGHQPAAAQRIDSFSLTGQWALDFAEERCTLQGTFSDGSKQVRLVIQSYGDTDEYRATIIGDPLPRSSKTFDQIRYILPADTKERAMTRSFTGQVDGKRALSFPLRLGPELPKDMDPPDYSPVERETYMQSWRAGLPAYQQDLREITLVLDSWRHIRLNTGPILPVMNAMRLCARDLQQHWGLDPAVEENLSRRAAPDERTRDRILASYPYASLDAGINAYISVRFMVGADGLSTACVVQVQGVRKEFGSAICGSGPSRFRPALDENGQPVASVFRSDVTFQIQ